MNIKYEIMPVHLLDLAKNKDLEITDVKVIFYYLQFNQQMIYYKKM